MSFARGARTTRDDDDGFDESIVDSGVLRANHNRRSHADADYLGMLHLAGGRYQLEGRWRSTAHGERVLRLQVRDG